MDKMTFEQFVNWCDDRACDSCWGFTVAATCIDVIGAVRKVPFWKREKFWRDEYEHLILANIVIPLNEKISEYKKIV